MYHPITWNPSIIVILHLQQWYLFHEGPEDVLVVVNVHATWHFHVSFISFKIVLVYVQLLGKYIWDALHLPVKTVVF